MDIFNFDPESFLSFLLTMFRLSILVFMLPFFQGKAVPNQVKAALTLILTMAVWPQLSFSGTLMPASIWDFVLLIIGELLLGLVLSLVITFFFTAVQFAGNLVGFQMGFSMVNAMDPLTGINEVVTAHFMYMITILTFLVLNGHLYMLKALADSFHTIPPGGLVISADLAIGLLGMSAKLFEDAIRIAAPVMVAVFLVDLSLGLIGRAAPQMHLLVFGFPLKISVGFLFMGLLFTVLSRFVEQFIMGIGPAFHNIFQMGAPG